MTYKRLELVRGYFSQGEPQEDGVYLVYGKSWDFPTILERFEGIWRTESEVRSPTSLSWGNWHWMKIPSHIEQWDTNVK